MFPTGRKPVLKMLPVAAAVVALLVGGKGAYGQAAATAGSNNPVEIALLYQTFHLQTPVHAAPWMQGGAFMINAPFFHGLGATASITGADGHGDPTNLPTLKIFTGTAGLSYRMTRGRFSITGDAQGGEARTYTSTIQPIPSGRPFNGTAMRLGGGIDMRLSAKYSVRLIQGDWVRTTLYDGYHNVQSNAQLGAGIVYRFGR